MPNINNKFVSIAHGSGTEITRQFIHEIFTKEFEHCQTKNDSAIIFDSKIAYTTDSYVIKPEIFPGGDIGKLAVCGTANDLSVAGSLPKWFSVGYIISVGYPINKLEQIVRSMAKTAKESNIEIVTGDTKVIEGEVPGVIINTSGIGIVKNATSINYIKDGDLIIISGTLGDHAAAIVSKREGLFFEEIIKSDCAVLYPMLKRIINLGIPLFMRDMTRGGMSSALYEINENSGLGIEIYRNQIPIKKNVQEFCDITGMDPISLANEGKVLLVVDRELANKVLSYLQKHPLGKDSTIVGQVTKSHNEVIVKSHTKQEILREGIGIPRIC